MMLPAQCLARAERLLARALSGQHRVLLGIAAPPGAGKSTLAHALQEALAPHALVVPMDGFHLANVELRRLGRSARKGAADTFDVAGYAHLLHRIRNQASGEVVYAPDFRRDLEEAVAGAIAVDASTPLIITEGNYLLRAEPAWQRVRGLLDAVWYLEPDDAVRQQRLLERHMRFGRSQAEALAWIADNDEPNAQEIRAGRDSADWVITDCGETDRKNS